MDNTFTFQQPRSQKRVVFIIFGATFLMLGGTFGIFALLGTESAASFVAFMVLVAGVMIAIVRIAKSGVLNLQITVGQEGFSIENQQTSERRNYQWADVTKSKRGSYRYQSLEKSYLWIWVKDGRSYFIEDNGADAARAAQFAELNELAAHYLAANGQAKANA